MSSEEPHEAVQQVASMSSRRWRPRFSLRSLLLIMLLIATGFGLWRRWEPWVLVITKGAYFRPIRAVAFYPDSKFFIAGCHIRPGPFCTE